MYLFQDPPALAAASGIEESQKVFETTVERLTRGLLEELSGKNAEFYRDQLVVELTNSEASYSLKTAVARALATWPIPERAIHDPFGDWQVEHALNLAAAGGPLSIRVGNRLNSRVWKRTDLLAALSQYEFNHRGTVELTLIPIGSPIRLSLELGGKKKSAIWSLNGASRFMPSHREVLRLLNSAIEDRCERMGWLSQLKGKRERPGLEPKSIQKLEKLTRAEYSYFDFSLLAAGSYLTAIDDCYEVSANRRIYFSRCSNCEKPIRAEVVEYWKSSPTEDIWKSDKVLHMGAMTRWLNSTFEKETKNHCGYDGHAYSSRTGLSFGVRRK